MRIWGSVPLAVLVAVALFVGPDRDAVTADVGGRPFRISLTGAAEVTAAGVPNQGDPDGSGTAEVRLNPGQEEICVTLTVTGIAPATAAHIHRAPATSTGPVVVPVPAPTSGVSQGCVSASRELIQSIIRNPAAYYVNVHNTAFPAGALRGQLAP